MNPLELFFCADVITIIREYCDKYYIKWSEGINTFAVSTDIYNLNTLPKDTIICTYAPICTLYAKYKYITNNNAFAKIKQIPIIIGRPRRAEATMITLCDTKSHIVNQQQHDVVSSPTVYFIN